MRPIVNMPEEDRATAIGHMHKKIGKDRTWGSRDILSDSQIDALITILCNRSHFLDVQGLNSFQLQGVLPHHHPWS